MSVFGRGITAEDLRRQSEDLPYEELQAIFGEAEAYLADLWGADAALYRKETRELIAEGINPVVAGSAAFLRVRSRAGKKSWPEFDDLKAMASGLLDMEVPF